MKFLHDLFGWLKQPAPVEPAAEPKPKPAAQQTKRQPAWVGVWSLSLQEWITIHGRLPHGFEDLPRVQVPVGMLATFDAPDDPESKR